MCVAPVALRAGTSPAVDDQFRQASEAMRNGNLEEAGRGFAAVTKAAPTFAQAYLNLGLVREEQGRHEEAISNLQKALGLKPRLHGANLFLGIAHFHLSQLEPAAAAIQKEVAAYAKDPQAWMWLGIVRLAQEKPEQAAEALDKAAGIAPDDIDILYHRGRAHLLVSNLSYAKMFKVDPHSWRVHQVIAQADAEARNGTSMPSLNTRPRSSSRLRSPASMRNLVRSTGIWARLRKRKRPSFANWKSTLGIFSPSTN